MGFLHFAPFSPRLTDIFYSANTGRGGFEIWLTDVISKYLFQSIMGGGRYGGGAGLMLAASGWTDRPDWHAVFVSEKWSVGPGGISGQIQPWCSARAWGGTVRAAGCQLSIAASTGTASREELVWFFFFFFCLKAPLSLIHLFLVFLMEVGNSSFLTLSLCLPCSLSALLSVLLCNKLWGMRRERGKIKGSPHTLPSNIIRLSLMALL